MFVLVAKRFTVIVGVVYKNVLFGQVLSILCLCVCRNIKEWTSNTVLAFSSFLVLYKGKKCSYFNNMILSDWNEWVHSRGHLWTGRMSCSMSCWISCWMSCWMSCVLHSGKIIHNPSATLCSTSPRCQARGYSTGLNM